MTDDNFKAPVDSAMDQAAIAGPAYLADRFVISIKGAVVRIGFLENDMDGGLHHRAAVALRPEDAISLYKILGDMMRPFEEVITQTQGAR